MGTDRMEVEMIERSEIRHRLMKLNTAIQYSITISDDAMRSHNLLTARHFVDLWIEDTMKDDGPTIDWKLVMRHCNQYYSWCDKGSKNQNYYLRDFFMRTDDVIKRLCKLEERVKRNSSKYTDSYVTNRLNDIKWWKAALPNYSVDEMMNLMKYANIIYKEF